MKPFDLSPSLAALRDHYPTARDIQGVVRNGTPSDRVIIARQWLSEGIPYAFRSCPAIYESLRSWLSHRLSIAAKEVSVTGSARLGCSLSPTKIGKSFGSRSDLDLFVVSEELFQSICDDFCRWLSDFRNGNLTPKNDNERRYWHDNGLRGPTLVQRGFMDSWMIPNREAYKTTRRINSALWMVKKKLDLTEHAPAVRKATLRCYESWNSYERQQSRCLDSLD